MTHLPPLDINTVCAFCGFLFGICGALLLMVKSSRFAPWGWVLYLASNVSWIAYSSLTSQMILLAQTLCFTATSFIGIWTWLIAPAIRAQKRAVHADKTFAT